MEKVLGIGGVFLRAKDPKTLSAWYGEHLGLPIEAAWNGATLPLSTPEDPRGSHVVWSAFPAETKYFGRRENACMVNFRVRDLDALVAQLRAAGCDVDAKVEANDFGKFGWVTDPEGNRVELWQPPDRKPGATA